MIYTKTITAGSGGSAAVPLDTDLPVTDGLIYQFELYFPPGSSGLLYVRVADGSFPVWPSEPGEWFYGDNTLITFPDRYYIRAPNHNFKVWYYNLDDTYDHKFTVRIGQVSSELFISSFIPGFGEKSFEDVIGQMVADQAAIAGGRQEKIDEYFGPEAEVPLPEGLE